jgi:hypothetical protein
MEKTEMMDKEELKTRALAAIENRRDALIEIGRALYAMPETGSRSIKARRMPKGYSKSWA